MHPLVDGLVFRLNVSRLREVVQQNPGFANLDVRDACVIGTVLRYQSEADAAEGTPRDPADRQPCSAYGCGAGGEFQGVAKPVMRRVGDGCFCLAVDWDTNESNGRDIQMVFTAASPLLNMRHAFDLQG